MIKDSYNRIHNYLRISLTDNCNLRCFYCMPEEDYQFTPVSKLMQANEIEMLAKIFVQEGVKKIRLTGGEPLVRKDAGQIIALLGRLPVELTLTTNATRIHEFISVLKESNVQTVNVSLDTLQPDKFLLITRRDNYHLVRSNIELLLRSAVRLHWHLKPPQLVVLANPGPFVYYISIAFGHDKATTAWDVPGVPKLPPQAGQYQRFFLCFFPLPLFRFHWKLFFFHP